MLIAAIVVALSAANDWDITLEKNPSPFTIS